MSYWADRNAARRRSLYEAMVTRAMIKHNDMDGSEPSKAVPHKLDKTWLEEQGLTNDKDTGTLYLQLLDDWLDHPGNGLYLGDDAWTKWKNDCEAIRRDSMEGRVVRARIRQRRASIVTTSL